MVTKLSQLTMLENSGNQGHGGGQIRHMKLEQRIMVLQNQIQQLNTARTTAVTALQGIPEASTIDLVRESEELPPIYTVE